MMCCPLSCTEAEKLQQLEDEFTIIDRTNNYLRHVIDAETPEDLNKIIQTAAGDDAIPDRSLATIYSAAVTAKAMWF